MEREEIIKELGCFNDLTYVNKLKFWDEKGMAFYYDVSELNFEKAKAEEGESLSIEGEYSLEPRDEDYSEIDEEEALEFYQQEFANEQLHSDSLFLSIRPFDLEERIIYNKWVIDHWRDWFRNQKGKISKSGFLPLYKSIDDLVEHFEKLVNKKPDKERREIINRELSLNELFIKDLRIKSGLVKAVYSMMKANLESDIYKYRIDQTSALIKLRQIGRIWDRVKFQVFLESQLILPTSKKNGLKHIRSFEMSDLGDHQIKYLFKNLLDYGFIHKDTKYLTFKHILVQNDTVGIPKIKWIDVADSKNVNKIPLIVLFDQIVLGDTAMRNQFIVTHFSTYTDNQEQNISLENIKQSRKQLKNQKAQSSKQELILKIFSTMP